jgi:SNF2 family DNA or RNA helicase
MNSNLTGANHAIFISPLLTNTQENYDACMTQAIGRVRRYGQQKKVHIYHFLSKDTIDVDLYQQMTGQKLAL